MPERQVVTVEGRELGVSNLDKVLYPEVGFSKAHVIDYYVKIAPVLLPHLAGRPLTMLRCPDGVQGERFFEKRCPDHRPEFVGTVRLGREGKDKVVDHCDIGDVAALVWVANLASLELHTSLARKPDTFTPTMVVFDLDPGAPATIVECARVAMWLHEVFERLDLVAVPKTSGGSGMQVYVPVNTPTGYEQTKGFALAVGQLLERVHGEHVTTNMNKRERTGKVFIDWSQNVLTKTTVCAYSLRARAQPTVSTPLRWEEVAALADGGDADQARFLPPDVLARVDAHGDLFAPAAQVEQALPELG
ncbi:MAG TPA: non-homologous end-joining DNA ligase [Nitriliruptorales bacterium]